MTRDEFERRYAERSNMTVEEFRELGYLTLPCACGDSLCQGWQKVTLEGAMNELKLNRVTQAEFDEACRLAHPSALETADDRFARIRQLLRRG